MKLIFQDALVSQECIECGITFAITETVDAQLRKSKRSFRCPNGHIQAYTRGEVDDFRDKVASLTKQTASKSEHIDRLHIRIEELTRSNASLRGVITKLQKKDPEK